MLSKHSSKHSSRVKNVQQCALKWIYDENWKMRSGRVLAQIFMNERTDTGRTLISSKIDVPFTFC